MRVLIWHVHGSWTTSFVHGPHDYLVPVLPDRGPDGLGRARTWDWPASVVEVTPEEALRADIDVVILQRPQELRWLAEEWTGRRPGRDLPAVYVEHNAPDGPAAETRHPAAGLPGVVIAHVTHFNRLMWDTGPSEAVVIEHGVVDPGHRYTGRLAAAAMVVNDPLRRGRVPGTDLLADFRARARVDLFGMRSEPLGGVDLPQHRLHTAMARRRVYLHVTRWTSLGLSLIEAMHLGMPVVALATTEVAEAVPAAAGVVTNRLDRLADALVALIADREEARARGDAARHAALTRYGHKRFLGDWDRLLEEVTR